MGPVEGAIGMDPRLRFKRDRPCPVCGGHADLPQGEGRRCYGHLSDDGLRNRPATGARVTVGWLRLPWRREKGRTPRHGHLVHCAGSLCRGAYPDATKPYHRHRQDVPSGPAIGAPPQERRQWRTPEALQHGLTTTGYECLKAHSITDAVIDASGARWVRAGKADGADTAAAHGFPRSSFGLFFPTRPLLARQDLSRGILRRFDDGAGEHSFLNQTGQPTHLTTTPGFDARRKVGRDYASIPDAGAELNQHGYIIVEGHTRVLALTGIGLGPASASRAAACGKRSSSMPTMRACWP